MSSSKSAPRRARSGRDWEAIAWQALQGNDLVGARAALTEALALNPRNLKLRRALGTVFHQMGEIEEAAVHLTLALRFNPEAQDVARQLSRLFSRFMIEDWPRIDPFGLKAALALDNVDRRPLCDAAFRYLLATEPELAQAVAAASAGHGAIAAQRLLQRATSVVRNDLLLAILQAEVVTDPDVERLFTALRRSLLLDADRARLEDRTIFALALALLGQGINNDYAWAETEEETRALSALVIDKEAVLAGDLGAAMVLLLRSLYSDPGAFLADVDAAACRAIRPKPLRDLLSSHLAARDERREAARNLPRLAGPTDDTSRRVTAQYEASPYPRWQSLHVSPPGSLRLALQGYFKPPELAFMDRPFGVLIPGAGTGHQALQSAFAYGPNASLLAIDLSAPSLGYATVAARRYGARNVEFMVADILNLDRLDRQFEIIECVGVLHHLKDPWLGWRNLIAKLGPGGLMYIGLYSSISRANIRRLRSEPGYPGPGCTDRAARAYRASLLARPDGEPGAELKLSNDFYALREFRDLVLHESEQQVTLEEVEEFLARNHLEFRGFTLDGGVWDDFVSHCPNDPWPGKLANWAGFERDHQRTFDGMYRFWCARA
jgi:SAM-dependent methyltransferase